MVITRRKSNVQYVLWDKCFWWTYSSITIEKTQHCNPPIFQYERQSVHSGEDVFKLNGRRVGGWVGVFFSLWLSDFTLSFLPTPTTPTITHLLTNFRFRLWCRRPVAVVLLFSFGTVIFIRCLFTLCRNMELDTKSPIYWPWFIDQLI